MKRVTTFIMVGLMALIFVIGCGQKENGQEENKIDTLEQKVESTEQIKELETEEVNIEEETESETERNVLFRIKISNTTGTYVRNKPNNVEFEDCFLVDYGTEYDVYSVYDNENEGCAYYEVEVNGKTEYVWEEDAEIL